MADNAVKFRVAPPVALPATLTVRNGTPAGDLRVKWGAIFGDIADQTDLQSLLATYASKAELAEPGGSSLVGFLQSGEGAVARTEQDKGRDLVNAKDFSTLDQAFVAGARGVIIPGDFNPETAIVNGSNNYPLIDFRHKFVGVFSEIAPAYPADSFPFGHDLVLRARGSADTYIEHFNLACTTTDSLVVGANTNVLISSVTCGNNRAPAGSGTGTSAFFSTSGNLVIGRETANEETVSAGNWSIVDGTHLSITCTKTHAGTTDIEMIGSTLLNSQDLYIGSNVVKPAQPPGYDAPLRLKDLGGRFIAKIPSNINNTFPHGAWQWGAIQTGMNGENRDLVYRHAASASVVRWLDSGNSPLVTIDANRMLFKKGISCGDTQAQVAGTVGEIQVGNATSAITSTTDAHILWLNSSHPLNSLATAGSLLLASRNVGGAGLIFATGNAVQGSITTTGMRITAGFGCNGKAPQASVIVNAAATDAATTQALVNQLRAALIANGICV